MNQNVGNQEITHATNEYNINKNVKMNVCINTRKDKIRNEQTRKDLEVTS